MLLGRSVVVAVTVTLVGCAPSFDSQSKVQELRVFAIQKDNPYPKPGDTVDMTMLWADGAPNAPRDVVIAWFSGCFNPPGDLFTGCLEQFAGIDATTDPADLPDTIEVGEGPQFSFTIPSDIITRKDRLAEGAQPFGTAFVFFAACAGRLDVAPDDGEDLSFPLACFGPDESMLGADDFVAGYSQVFVYDELTNANPILTGFEINGREVQPDCIGTNCAIQPIPDVPVDCDVMACVKACPDDGAKSCPDIPIKPIIDRSSAELDTATTFLEDRELQEQMWVNYYADSGRVEGDVRLLNDALTGWNEDFGTNFRAPSEPGVMFIWAVAHDNRGGAEWVRVRVQVNP